MAELTALDAARVVGVHRQSVARWCQDQSIKARKYGLRGDWRIDVDDLRRFAHQYNYDFDEELAAKLGKN